MRTQNESLQRRLQLLDEEAEESDRNIRETNEKYGLPYRVTQRLANSLKGCAKQMSKPAISNAKCKLWRARATSGKRSTRRWQRSTMQLRRNWKTSSSRSAICETMLCGERTRGLHL